MLGSMHLICLSCAPGEREGVFGDACDHSSKKFVLSPRLLHSELRGLQVRANIGGGWVSGHGLPGCAEEEQVWRDGVSENPSRHMSDTL